MPFSSFDGFTTPAFNEILERINCNNPPQGGSAISVIINELKPADLYCYLYAKFGAPNGIQNHFRKDDSANLIHWDWTFIREGSMISILGMNMRTEVHFYGDCPDGDASRKALIEYIKSDFKNHGKRMAEIRSQLENWILFTNPHKQLRDAVNCLKKQLDALQLTPESEELQNPNSHKESEEFSEKWKLLADRYANGFGLSISIRALTPVLVESFVNLIQFVLIKNEIKNNERLYENAKRQPIDIKIQSLHINCHGFKSPIDWTHDSCRKYHTLINERNDMLHGNVSIEKQKTSEIYFAGKIPIFKNYGTLWRDTLGTSITASGMQRIPAEAAIADEFIEYIKSCMNDNIREDINFILNKRDLGFNPATKRLGNLLPDELMHFYVSFD